MRVSGRALGIGALLLLMGAALVFWSTNGSDSPEHSTASDAANGTSALLQIAQALGHPTGTLDSGFNLDSSAGALFVFNPTVPYTRDEANQVVSYLEGGGTLVYAADSPDLQLDFALHVSRQFQGAVEPAVSAGPMLAGVEQVTGSNITQALAPAPAQVVILRGQNGRPAAIEEAVGRGRAFVLTDPLPLCNGHLLQADNGRLATDLVALAPAGSPVLFDEFHHGAGGNGSPVTGILTTPWLAAIAWAVLALFVGLLLRGRVFGPRLEPFRAPPPAMTEQVAAAARLLRRSGAVRETGALVLEAGRRARGADAEAAVEEAEAALAPGDERGLLAAARRVHPVVYPDRPSR